MHGDIICTALLSVQIARRTLETARGSLRLGRWRVVAGADVVLGSIEQRVLLLLRLTFCGICIICEWVLSYSICSCRGRILADWRAGRGQITRWWSIAVWYRRWSRRRRICIFIVVGLSWLTLRGRWTRRWREVFILSRWWRARWGGELFIPLRQKWSL
jgi:hypothetical protein